MSFNFSHRDDVTDGERPIVLDNVVQAATSISELDANQTYSALRENFVISCAYWLLNMTSSQYVQYRPDPATHSGTPRPITQRGQQGAGFVALAYLMGLVKDPTPENAPACKKRWAAGLAGLPRANSLSEMFMEGIWRFISDKKHTLYSHVEVRRDLLTKYLSMGSSRESEPSRK